MAQALFDLASEPKELWFVEGAKHNQALQIATEEYQRRVLTFFEAHLASRDDRRTVPPTNGQVGPVTAPPAGHAARE
jgi:hypothetical protein